ncbi:DUF481 domain-containing protein [Gammaproteobacteria bacterium AB-CW1]|uniref:DUF481 domain-containing protein n=1 Tax=Natronospira elongata TaxID=3110268 RepID=A0AAP6JGD8_9GAMM|nr:DUF481 domain-containing protein [Gammaproteobacteria bacterium AB-CW1]
MRKLLASLPVVIMGAAHAQVYGSTDQSIFGTVVDSAPDHSELELSEEFLEWSYGGRVEVGFQARRGNTERTDLNSRMLLGMEKGDWANTLELRAVSADDGEVTVEERYFLATKSEYSFTEYNFFFGTINAEKDRIRNVDLQTTEAVGYGRRILRTDRHRLDAEIGVGARQIQFRDDRDRVSDEIVRLASDYSWDINGSASLTQDVRVETGIGGINRTFAESITTLSATIVGELALNLSYTVRYLDDENIEQETKTDTITSIGLNYRF